MKNATKLALFGFGLCLSVFSGESAYGQKKPLKSPQTDSELLQLADRMVTTSIKKKSNAAGDEFLQRDLTGYLKNTVFSQKDVKTGADHGHDHKEELLAEYLNRPQPSVKTMEKYFKEAAKEFKVPQELLMAIGQVQSNWVQVSESMYGSWGVMGLVENQFTKQITEAAALLKVSPQQIKDDAKTNIRAAAALLASYQKKEAASLEDWFDATKELTGLQNPVYKEKLALRFFELMSTGSKSVTLWSEIIDLPSVKVNTKQLKGIEQEYPKQKGSDESYISAKPVTKALAAAPPTDYSQAVADFTTCNYNSRNGAPIEYYFVHYVATGTYEGAIDWFKNCSSQVSAHYVIRNSDGEVTQVVAEANRSWSQGVGYYNDRGIGTEHEVLATNLAMWYSDPMLTAAGQLANDVCTRRNIPKVRAVAAPGINGHNDVKSTSCPNMTAEVWSLFLNKVSAAAGGTNPARPTLYTLINPGTGTGVKATWKANTESNLVGYRLYYAIDDALTTWALAADENTLGTTATQVTINSSADFIVPPTGNVYHFKLVAVGTDAQSQKIESLESDIYSRSSAITGPSVLIVDGFDRTNGSYTSAAHSFATGYFKALRDSRQLKINTVANEKVEDGTVLLSDYQLVIWFVGDESTVNETFSTTEQTKVQTYLTNGGKLIVSGSEIAWDLDSNGSTADKAFINNYLKAKYVGDGASNYTPATGVAGTTFAGLSIPFGITYPEDFPDNISINGGSAYILNYAVSSTRGGVAYKGVFGAGTQQGGVIYVTFPLETASQANQTSFTEKALTYFGIGASAPVAVNDAGQSSKNTALVTDVLANDQSNGNAFDLATVTVVTAPAHGTAIVNTSTGKITYTPATDYLGSDSFVYNVKDVLGVSSNNATVSMTIVEPTLCSNNGPEVNSSYPKRDLRGCWISTVSNIDWPSSPTAAPAVQQQELKLMLDSLASAGVNTVFFQIRPESDALYASTIEPWSYYLTGQQGQAPSPMWDPLSYIVNEAHARGLELHAWINPYRAKQGTPTLASNHVASVHPEWTFVAESKTFLNPGIPQVRNYLLSVITDIITRYNIDGIHFDDYFYPYSGMTNQDAATYTTYNPSSLSLADWRRDNVNKMVTMVYDKIQEVNAQQNKNIRFGISPFGIWKSGVPSGITGLSSYNDIYCDPIAWLQAGKVDYLAPQLYWGFGGGQDYSALVAWWDDQAALYGRHLYPGLALYRLTDSNWPASTIQSQVNENRISNNMTTLGQIFFTANDLIGNDKSIKTLLKQNQYKYKSIPPSMSWKDGVCPSNPSNLHYQNNKLIWNKALAASDGDKPTKYVVYRFLNTGEITTNAQDGTKIVGVTADTSFTVTAGMLSGVENYFVVSSIDKNNNESVFSSPVNVTGTLSYCNSKGLNSTYEWISKVTIGAFVHSSGNDAGYGDFTAQQINLAKGGTFSISLQPAYSSTIYNEYWKVWIDFNKDGDFLDAGELVFNPGGVNKNTVTGSITIPASAADGKTRMRVSMNGTSADYTTEPCTNFAYGEVQDYTINLTPEGSCVAPSVTEKIIDDATATFTGTWSSGTSAGYYGTGYKHDSGTGQGTKTAKFTPALQETGSYEVYTYYVAGTNRATNVPIDINHLQGTTTVTLNQQVNGSTWVSLGTFDFDASTNSNVVIKNNSTNGVVIADAFRWVYKGCPAGAQPLAMMAQPEELKVVESSGFTSTAQRVTQKESTQEEEFVNTVIAYPNPFSYELNLEIVSDQKGVADISVVNANGKRVAQLTKDVEIGKTGLILNGAQWDRDLYFILVRMPNGKTIQVNVIKQ